jgi:glycosyltransferase involved in cell wall biosynthesis
MEAISFGIPVMATDVGGCREIVTDSTGILIPKDFDVKEAARLISEFYQSEKNKEVFRKGVKSFWKTNFEVFKNYREFFEDLERS